MKRSVVVAVCASLTLSLGACSTPQFQTLNIFDSPNRVVALRAMPDAYRGKGYDHPVTFTTEEMSRLLKGIRVQRGLLSSTQHAALSETESTLCHSLCEVFGKGDKRRDRDLFLKRSN